MRGAQLGRLAAAWCLAAAGLAAGGCSNPEDAPTSPLPPGPSPEAPDRVLVLNSLSETLSILDLADGTMTGRFADTAPVPNRITHLPAAGAFAVTASGSNRIEIRNEFDLSVRHSIDLGPGSNPWDTAVGGGLEGIVTNWISGSVRRVDFTREEPGPSLAVTPGPEGAAISGNRAFIACTNWQADGVFGPGKVDVVDLTRWRVIASVDVGTNPQDLFVDDDGRVHVVCTGNYGVGPAPEAGSLHVFDAQSLQPLATLDLGGSPGRLEPGDGVVWVAGVSGGVRSYDAATLALLPDPTDPALSGPDLSAVAWDAETGTLYVTNFALDLLVSVDAASLQVRDVWITGDGPVDIAVSRPGAED